VTGRSVLVKAISSGMGLGYLPVAPGTWASAGSAAVYWLLCQLPGRASSLALAAVFLATVVVGLLVCRGAQAVYGQSDPRRFVLDEMAGLWLTCLLFQWRGPAATALAAFVAFRVFDAVKPFPLRRLEKLPGAWGVMADDLVAGLYSALALWVVCYGLLDRVAP